MRELTTIGVESLESERRGSEDREGSPAGLQDHGHEDDEEGNDGCEGQRMMLRTEIVRHLVYKENVSVERLSKHCCDVSHFSLDTYSEILN